MDGMLASEEVEEEELDESIRNGDGDDASNEKGFLKLSSPAPSDCSIAVNSHGKLDIKTSGTDADDIDGDQMDQDGCQSWILSKCCQTRWNWDEDLKLISMHSDELILSKISSDFYEIRLKSGSSDDLRNAMYKSPLKLHLFGSDTESIHGDLSPKIWEAGDSVGNIQFMPLVKTISSLGPPQILQHLRESSCPMTISCCDLMNRSQTIESYKSLDEDLQRYINELDETALRLILTNSHPAVCQFCGKEASDNPYCCKDYENFLRILHPEEHLVGKFLSRISGQYHFHRSSQAGRGRKETEQHFDPRIKSRGMVKQKDGKERPSGIRRSVRDSEVPSGKSQQTSQRSRNRVRKDREHSRKLQRTSDIIAEKEGSSDLRPSTFRSKSKEPVKSPIGSIESRRLKGSSASPYQQTKQLKTITYQLSSKKCLEDGWTIQDFSSKSSCREMTDDYDALIPISKKKGSSELFMKSYDNGSTFAVIFPDGSGSIFHSSGKVAVSVVLVGEGLYTYIIQDNSRDSRIVAVFQSDGRACIFYSNGKLRVILSPVGGIELGQNGSRKRKWLWQDMYDQHQRAPLQPITIGVTPECGIRIMSQSNITVTYQNECRNIRLHVGTRLMLVSPQRALSPRGPFEEDEQFRKSVKSHVESLISRILTILEFPKSSNLPKIPSSFCQQPSHAIRHKFTRIQPVLQSV